MKTRPVGAELINADGRMDEHTWRRWQSLFAIFRTHLIKKTETRRCFEWVSNLRSQCLSGGTQDSLCKDRPLYCRQ